MYGQVQRVLTGGDELIIDTFTDYFPRIKMSNEERKARQLYVGALVWFPNMSDVESVVVIDLRDCDQGVEHGNHHQKRKKLEKVI